MSKRLGRNEIEMRMDAEISLISHEVSLSFVCLAGEDVDVESTPLFCSMKSALVDGHTSLDAAVLTS